LYWQRKYRELEESTRQIESEVARIEPLKIMSEIKKIMDYDLNSFISYLSDTKGLPLSELITTNFSAIINSIDPSTKRVSQANTYVSILDEIKLDKGLAEYKDAISQRINRYPYNKNVFLMMRYRSYNANTYHYIKKIIKTHGLNCVRADELEWNITSDVRNPIAVMSCCKYGMSEHPESPTPDEMPSENTYFIKIGNTHSR